MMMILSLAVLAVCLLPLSLLIKLLEDTFRLTVGEVGKIVIVRSNVY